MSEAVHGSEVHSFAKSEEVHGSEVHSFAKSEEVLRTVKHIPSECVKHLPTANVSEAYGFSASLYIMHAEFSDKTEVTFPPNSEIRIPNLRSIVPYRMLRRLWW
ncbi:MAG: hypothetical protein IJA39_03010 [Clostridia bacterium]|nr:hypothetical protein [Clostridia bacterium]